MFYCKDTILFLLFLIENKQIKTLWVLFQNATKIKQSY